MYTQTETTLVCMSECCVVKVGVVFNVVDKFQCRSGILSGCNLNLVFLPKLWQSGNFVITLSTGRIYFTSVKCTHVVFPPSVLRTST